MTRETGKSPEHRSITITTPAWVDQLLPSDATALARFVENPPELTDLVVRSIRLERRGPGCTLRIDLSGSVQCNLGFLAVDDVRMSGGALPDICTVELAAQPTARLAVTVAGRSVRLSLTCSDRLRIGRFSTHDTPAGEQDTGPHEFASKLDQRLYTTAPDGEVDSYYERF